MSTITEHNRELPRVAIVSVTYNRCEPLLFLLAGLRELDYPRDRFDIYLADNASSDATVRRVRQEFPEVHLIANSENLGTSAGFNIGMREALGAATDYEFIWLLDSDAEVEAATLKPMVDAMAGDASIGIVGSTVYDPQNRERVVATGLHVDWKHGGVSLVKSTAANAAEVNSVDLVAACSLLIRTDICREFGLWDERFWIYWGDTDWCQRVIRAGFRVCGHFRSRVWHRDWANTQKNFNAPTVIYDDLRGGLLFNLRHNPRHSLSGSRHLVLKSCLKAAMEQLTMRGFFARAYDEAVQDLLQGDFRRRGLNDIDDWPPVRGLAEVCEQLRALLPGQPAVLLNQLGRPQSADEVRRQFEAVFEQPRWHEVDPDARAARSDFTTDYSYFAGEIFELVKYLLRPRHDVVVGEIGKPHLYTLAAARYTVLIDDAGNALLQRNRVWRGLGNALKILFRGLGYAYIRLPRAYRGNSKLRQAISNVTMPGEMPGSLQSGNG